MHLKPPGRRYAARRIPSRSETTPDRVRDRPRGLWPAPRRPEPLPGRLVVPGAAATVQCADMSASYVWIRLRREDAAKKGHLFECIIKRLITMHYRIAIFSFFSIVSVTPQAALRVALHEETSKCRDLGVPLRGATRGGGTPNPRPPPALAPNRPFRRRLVARHLRSGPAARIVRRKSYLPRMASQRTLLQHLSL